MMANQLSGDGIAFQAIDSNKTYEFWIFHFIISMWFDQQNFQQKQTHRHTHHFIDLGFAQCGCCAVGVSIVYRLAYVNYSTKSIEKMNVRINNVCASVSTSLWVCVCVCMFTTHVQ